jgi:hypothetical protein
MSFNKEMQRALEADGEKLRQLTGEDHGPSFDDYHDDYEDECPNCGGEGIVYCCFEEFACIDPDGGCADCARRCDWCQPRKQSPRVTETPHD